MSNAPTTKQPPTPDLDFGSLKRIVRPRKGAERVTLRTLREGLGKTQAEVARSLETDQGEVSRIERRPDIMTSTLRKYAAALGARCEVVFVLDDGRRVLIAEPDADEPSPR
jgi:transcriptional regulator with XRE-family HTH domain